MSRPGSRLPRFQGTKSWGSLLLTVLVAAAAFWFQDHPGASSQSQPSPAQHTSNAATSAVANGALPAFLPSQARQTLALIASGGPFLHPQDGGVFGNYEGRLPPQPRGWYHEYTVETPGRSNRGTRRIITGGMPPQTYWYTDDHYDSFREFQVPGP